MTRLLPLHIGAGLAAAGSIGGGVAGILDGSWLPLTIAGLCALICVQLEAIAFIRAMSIRLDGLHRALSADHAATAPVNGNGGRL